MLNGSCAPILVRLILAVESTVPDCIVSPNASVSSCLVREDEFEIVSLRLFERTHVHTSSDFY